MNQGQTVTATFELVNDATYPVRISDVLTTCGCTSADAHPAILQPTEYGRLKVTWYIGDRRGKISSFVHVFWSPLVDDGTGTSIELTLCSEVFPDIQFSPDELVFDAYTPESKTVHFTPGRLPDVRLLNAYSQSIGLIVTADPDSSLVHVMFDPTAWTFGEVMQPVIVETTSPNAANCAIPVTIKTHPE